MISKAYKEKNEKWIYWLLAAVFVFVPFISAFIFCFKDGQSINDIAIYLGGWSDEITYYKQIEGMVEYGIPRGYFGYDQSRAIYGPFAVWGIFPLLPYFLVGKIIGFNYSTMLYTNILMCMIALLIFVCLIRPKKRTMLGLSLIWILYYDLNRHILSGVVEAIFIAGLIVVFALGCYLISDKVRDDTTRKFTGKKDYIAFMGIIALICYMSICRPYFSVLFLIPFIALFIKRKYLGCTIVSAIAGLNLVVFFVNYKYFCSKYFSDILEAEAFNLEGIMDKLLNVVDNMGYICKLAWYAVRYSDVPGWYYISFFIIIFTIILHIIFSKMKRQNSSKMLICALIGYVLIFISILLIYDVVAGARHILALNIGCIFLLAIEIDHKVNCIFVGICLLSILLVGTREKVPYATEEYKQYISELEEDLSEVIQVTDEISYDNVMAMPTRDFLYSNPSQPVVTYYGNMFAVPAGMGISLDTYERYEDLDEVAAKYVMCHPEGIIYNEIKKTNRQCIYENEEFAIYQMYE